MLDIIITIIMHIMDIFTKLLINLRNNNNK